MSLETKQSNYGYFCRYFQFPDISLEILFESLFISFYRMFIIFPTFLNIRDIVLISILMFFLFSQLKNLFLILLKKCITFYKL